MNIPYEELFDSSVTPNQDKWTQNALAGLPTCKGVLLFIDASGNPIQLLQAANLRKTAQARQLHDETGPAVRKKTDVSDLTAVIYYLCCYNNFLSHAAYTQLAHTIFGKDSVNWIQLPKVSLAAIDTDAFLPFFYLSETPFAKNTCKQFGLFPSRKAAAEFCDILNTVFVLCRNPILLKTGKESSCPYLQMRTCPGPCLHTELRSGYNSIVKQATEATSGAIENARQQLLRQMQQHSERMNFERAQDSKRKLGLLDKLTRSDFQWVLDLNEFCLLHIDIGPKEKEQKTPRKIRQLMWFKITPQEICRLGNFSPESEKDVKNFIETNWTNPPTLLNIKNRKELLSLISLQLFRSNRSGIWIDCTQGIWLEKIFSELNRCFDLKINPNSK